mgnify:FL=1
MSELDLSTPYATWVYLNRVVEGPSAALQALLTQYPAEERVWRRAFLSPS